MIEAVLFDFGQTLVDSAEGFRKAEKEGQTRIFADLGVESWPEFLSNYQRLRPDLRTFIGATTGVRISFIPSTRSIRLPAGCRRTA